MIKLKKSAAASLGDARCYARCKAALDACAALAAILLLLPLLLLISIGIRCTSPGPVLFRQVRLGRGMEPFLVYKFRTMSCRAPRELATAQLVTPERYITRFGAFLRRTSLDELPQLFNVLRGEMSLIGPRPVVLSEGELISRRVCAGVYRVKPGISGLSQVRGRDLLNDEEKTRLDGEYACGMSFWRDAILLLATMISVLFRYGIREGSPAASLSSYGGEGGDDLVRKRI